MLTSINFPQSINSEIHNYKQSAPIFPIIEDESDTGIAKRRLRSTTAIRQHSWEFHFTRDEYEIFQIWAWTNLVGGTLSFNMPWTSELGGGTKEVRFVLKDNKAFSIEKIDGDDVHLSVEVEEV